MNRSRMAALALGAALSSGCYGYIPVELEAVPPGEQVLVHLTRQGLADIPELPNLTSNALTGRVISRDATQLVLRVPTVTQRRASGALETLGQDIPVPVGEIIDVSRRELSRIRTGLLVAASIGAVVSAIISFGDVFNEAGPIVPPEEGIRVPLLRLQAP